MQRQSLSSPSSKHHGTAKEDDNNNNNNIVLDEPAKTHRMSSPPPRPPHKVIHLIPLLTILCFLILYLCSHTPSPSELDHFDGFKRSHAHHDSAVDLAAGISDIGHYTGERRTDVLAIRSLRNLQQIQKNRLHRKFADF